MRNANAYDRLCSMRTVIYFKASDRPADHKKLDGIRSMAREYGWNLQVVGPAKSAKTVVNILRLWNPDGCIVSCGSGMNDIPSKLFGTTPIVYLDRPRTCLTSDDSYVVHDSQATTQIAMRELMRLDLAHYAYVPWDEHLHWDKERHSAFSEIVQLHGKPNTTFPLRIADTTPQYTIKNLVRWLKALPKPLGIFAAADPVAILVLEACRLSNLPVPDDVSIISVNNDVELCENSTPTLSSIDPGFLAAGQLAANILQQRMAGKKRKTIQAIYHPIGLVRRKSTMRYAKGDKIVEAALERITCEACSGLTVKAILESFNCSRRMAEIRFHALAGTSILKAIQAVKLRKAKELLESRSFSVEAVSSFCGFRTASAFSMFFKSQTGVNPTKWRGQALYRNQYRRLEGTPQKALFSGARRAPT